MNIIDKLGNKYEVTFDVTDIEIEHTIKEKNTKKILPVNRSNIKENEVENFKYVYELIKENGGYIGDILSELAVLNIHNEYYYNGQIIPLAYVSNIYEEKTYNYGRGVMTLPIVLSILIKSRSELVISLESYGFGDDRYKLLYDKVSVVNSSLKKGFDKTSHSDNSKLDIMTYRYIYKEDIGKEPEEIKNKVVKPTIINRIPITKKVPIYTEKRQVGFSKSLFNRKDSSLNQAVKIVGTKESKNNLFRLLDDYNVLYDNVKKHILYVEEVDKENIKVTYYKEYYLINLKKETVVKLT